MALRANVLAKGFSGIRRETLEQLIALLNRRVHPVVPSRGSVGASGDLAPLAHLALVLVGEGFGDGRRRRPRAAADATALARRRPRAGDARSEGRAGAHQRHAAVDRGRRRWRWSAAERLARAADIAVALSIDALRGSVHPFEARIHDAAAARRPAHSAANVRAAARGQRHQQVARELRPRAGRLLAALRGAGARRGARRAAVRRADALTIEANAATDNPMVFADDGEIVSGGNFHGAPVAIAADLLAIARRRSSRRSASGAPIGSSTRR